jgi:hypothetical protein
MGKKEYIEEGEGELMKKVKSFEEHLEKFNSSSLCSHK